MLGPISYQPPKSNFISLITQAIESNKIVIESETNDTHSICFLDHLVHIVLDLLFDSKQGLQYFFDAVDITISLKDFTLQLADCLNLEEKDIVELQKLISTAVRIEDHNYQEALVYKRENKAPRTPLPPLEIKPVTDKAFSRFSLPTIQSPEQLYEIYLKPEAYQDEQDLFVPMFMM